MTVEAAEVIAEAINNFSTVVGALGFFFLILKGISG